MTNRSAIHAPQLVDTAGPGMKKAVVRSSAPPSLVELDEIILDRNELQGMVQMLRMRAEHVVVRVKRDAESKSHDPVTLGELAPLLVGGHLFGAQIQYSYNSNRWLDTLVVTSGGFRLVRVQMA